MTVTAVPEELDSLLLCYCAGPTVGELRSACRQGRWPPRKKRPGKLSTGCMGDLLHCLPDFGRVHPLAESERT